MIAVVNFETTTQNGLIHRIKQRIKPEIEITKADIKEISEEMYIFKTEVPILNKKGIKKALNVLKDKLFENGADKIIMPGGSYKDYLVKNGIKPEENRHTLLLSVNELLYELAKLSDIKKNSLKIMIFDLFGKEEGKELLISLASEYDGITVVTGDRELYEPAGLLIMEEYGAGTVITDVMPDTGGFDILISVSGTENIIKAGKKCVFLCCDESYRPKSDTLSEPISGFCRNLPPEIRKFCPFGMSYCEFQGIIWDMCFMGREEEYDISVYSYGKRISLQRVINMIRRKNLT